MKTLTFIFTIVGLIATFFIASFFFTRYELLELSNNHQALYEQGKTNISFDDWLDRTQDNLGRNQETVLYLKELLPLVYPMQKEAINQYINDSLDLINEHESMLTMLGLEIEKTPGFKKIWEIAFLNPESNNGKNATQALFKDLPDLINNLQANMGIMESHQQVTLKAKKLAEQLNDLLSENQLIGEVFMIEPLFPLAKTAWLKEDIRQDSVSKFPLTTNEVEDTVEIKEKVEPHVEKDLISQKQQKLNNKEPELTMPLKEEEEPEEVAPAIQEDNNKAPQPTQEPIKSKQSTPKPELIQNSPFVMA